MKFIREDYKEAQRQRRKIITYLSWLQQLFF